MSESNKSRISETFQKAAFLCSKQEMCTFDIRQKLKKWEVEENQADEIIQKLQEEKFLDEGRFTVAFAKDKFRFNKWGKQKIRYELKAKKISESVIKEALDEINEEEYFDLIKSELEKKKRSMKNEEKHAMISKLIRFGQSKGFEYELIMKIAKEIIYSK